MHFFRNVYRVYRTILIIFSLNGLLIPVSWAQLLVEQPVGSPVAAEGTRDFGFSINGSSTSLTFTIRNTGSTPLTGISVLLEGPAAGDYSIASYPPAVVLVGVKTNFIVTFSSTTEGLRSARLSIRTDSTPIGSYDINLTGSCISPESDTDSDGMGDAAEIKLASLGFNWQVAQRELVQTYYDNAAATGLYTASQVAELNVGTPLIQRKPDGYFVLSLGLQRSADLATFVPFPFAANGISVNGAGEIEFSFPSPGDAAFFRLNAK